MNDPIRERQRALPINLGDRVKDEINGFQGIVIGFTEYLYGCKHILVAPEETKDGKRLDAEWIDEGRCLLVEQGVVKRPESAAEREGADISTEPRPPHRR